MNNDTERYEGTPVTVGDKTYIVPPLSLGKMRKYLPMIKQLTSGVELDALNDEHFEMSSDIVFSSLKRNYPDLSKEFMEEEILNIDNLKEFIEAVCSASGLVRGKMNGLKVPAGNPLTLLS